MNKQDDFNFKCCAQFSDVYEGMLKYCDLASQFKPPSVCNRFVESDQDFSNNSQNDYNVTQPRSRMISTESPTRECHVVSPARTEYFCESLTNAGGERVFHNPNDARAFCTTQTEQRQVCTTVPVPEVYDCCFNPPGYGGYPPTYCPVSSNNAGIHDKNTFLKYCNERYRVNMHNEVGKEQGVTQADDLNRDYMLKKVADSTTKQECHNISIRVWGNVQSREIPAEIECTELPPPPPSTSQYRCFDLAQYISLKSIKILSLFLDPPFMDFLNSPRIYTINLIQRRENFMELKNKLHQYAMM